jgi:hypothetical protein
MLNFKAYSELSKNIKKRGNPKCPKININGVLHKIKALHSFQKVPSEKRKATFDSKNLPFLLLIQKIITGCLKNRLDILLINSSCYSN